MVVVTRQYAVCTSQDYCANPPAELGTDCTMKHTMKHTAAATLSSPNCCEAACQSIVHV